MIDFDKWFKPTLTIAAIIYILNIVIPLIVGVIVIVGMVVSGDIVISNGDDDLTSIPISPANQINTFLAVDDDYGDVLIYESDNETATYFIDNINSLPIDAKKEYMDGLDKTEIERLGESLK